MSRVLLGFRDPKVTRALQEQMDCREVKENRVLLDLLVRKGRQDREEILALKESRAPMELLACQEFQATQAKGVYKESKESLGLLGNQALREKKLVRNAYESSVMA